ncbi:hypothetical protein [Frigoriflavimonas asaccharolytica]|uniref:Uncharacterized protein n=1 Tax=Frigoriflavimonas asaccharolytica TaxID=2735899 RepID=A0A8J8K8M6_9FLAO|nr:hypothetical protein [Frigoriflavimonas asaccharolytica]NRS92791.1 hypothetical protein [Frigoriflavimonas asaccharolytica]
MKNPILEYRKELINWVNNLDDLEILSELLALKGKDKSIPLVSEPQEEYAVADDFDERFAKGMTGEEFREKIIEHIDSLPWER